MGLHGARLTSRVAVTAASAAAVAALFGAGTASAATTGTIALSTEGTSVSAAIDASTDVEGKTITCKFEVENQSEVTSTKTAFKQATSGGQTFKQTLTIDDLDPGKYDAKVHCKETGDTEVEGLDKTGVLTVSTAGGGTTTPPPVIEDIEDNETPAGPDLTGILALLQELLSGLFAS